MKSVTIIALLFALLTSGCEVVDVSYEGSVFLYYEDVDGFKWDASDYVCIYGYLYSQTDQSPVMGEYDQIMCDTTLRYEFSVQEN